MIRSSIVAALITVFVTACAGIAADPAVTESAPPPADSLQALYEASIEDARAPEPSDIYRGLTPITAYNTSLVWRGTPGESAVLVATWTDTSPDTSRSDSVRTEGDTWVTVAPELADFCHDLDIQDEALDVRIAQLLGLPPDVAYDRVVEMWVQPEDLFRPCPDPEISDTQCELAPPHPVHLIQIDAEHQSWIEEQIASSYGPNGYPWTRLGYTYDWGNPDSNIGLSEFVIQSGSTVIVRDVRSTNNYCQ